MPSQSFATPDLSLVQPLDTAGVLATSDASTYYIQVSKVAYRVARPLSYFSADRICSVAHLENIYQGSGVTQVSPCEFQINSPSPTPDYTLDLTWFDNQSTQPVSRGLSSLDGGMGAPAISVTQNAHDFSRLLGARTVLSVTTILNYYPVSATETDVITYSLSFIYNIPPGILGGANAIKTRFLNQIPVVISQTETAE